MVKPIVRDILFLYLLLECDVPVWYVESMKKIMYLFPKTHLIALIKRDICRFIKLYYPKWKNDNPAKKRIT